MPTFHDDASHPASIHRTPTPSTGIPAIPVATPSSDPTQPAFTADEATAYVQAHGFVRGHLSAKPSVTNVLFIPRKTLNSMLNGDGLSLPDDTLLCYVALEGEITFPGYNAPVTYHKGCIVFSAQTGNELMEGGLL